MELISPQSKALPRPVQTGDFSVIIPAGWGIHFIVFKNIGLLPATLSCGITPGGTELFQDVLVDGSGTNGGYSTQGSNFIPDISNPYTIYIHGNFNGMSIMPYIALERVF